MERRGLVGMTRLSLSAAMLCGPAPPRPAPPRPAPPRPACPALPCPALTTKRPSHAHCSAAHTGPGKQQPGACTARACACSMATHPVAGEVARQQPRKVAPRVHERLAANGSHNRRKLGEALPTGAGMVHKVQGSLALAAAAPAGAAPRRRAEACRDVHLSTVQSSRVYYRLTAFRACRAAPFC